MEKLGVSSVFVALFLVLALPRPSVAQMIPVPEFQKEVFQAVEAINTFVAKPDSISRTDVDNLLHTHKAHVTAMLTAKNYGFDPMPLPPNYVAAYKGLDIPLFRLRPEQKTGLGRFSANLAQRYGVEVANSPLLLGLFNGHGGFMQFPGRAVFIVTPDAIFTDNVNNFVNRHEAVHLKFWAFRRGVERDFLPKAPVHITFTYTQILKDEKKTEVLSKEMTFEEMVALSENIKGRALEVNTVQLPQARALFDAEIAKLLDVSQNVTSIATKALELFKNGQHVVVVQYPIGLIAGQFFELTTPELKMTFFLPEAEAKLCARQCERNLTIMLEKSVRLAMFNRDYFKMWRPATSGDASVNAALMFQKAQTDFIGTL